jgi:hypothetical protein
VLGVAAGARVQHAAGDVLVVVLPDLLEVHLGKKDDGEL